MHALSAAHINTAQRLKRFEAMIQSWGEQSLPCPLTVSLSANPVLDARLVQQKVDALQERYSDLTILTSATPLRQGIHYKRLLIDHGIDSQWLLFTDDDDLWAPDRTANIEQMIGQHPQVANTDAFLFPQHVRHAATIPDIDRRACLHVGTPKGALGSSYKLDNAHDVDAALLSGALTRSHARLFGVGCYWSYVVRNAVMVAFMKAASEQLLQHRCWDLCFLKCLHTHHNLATIDAKTAPINTDPTSNSWMYYWRIDAAAAQVLTESRQPEKAHEKAHEKAQKGTDIVFKQNPSQLHVPENVRLELQQKRLQALLEVYCAVNRTFAEEGFVEFAAAQGLDVADVGKNAMLAAFDAQRDVCERLLESP